MSVPFFYRMTHDMRITVRPEYLDGYSRPDEGQWVFGYQVRIENIGEVPARLLTRRWVIHDTAGEVTEIEGEGVVGEQPTIPPGGVHEYESYCILKSPNGTMEGEYRFVRPDQTHFSAEIPRFVLSADQEETA